MVALQSQNVPILWQKNLVWQTGASPLGLHDGVLYAASNNGIDGEIDAFNANNGSFLWHLPIGGNLWEVAFV